MKKIVARFVLPVLVIVLLFTASAVRSARAQPANREKIVGGPYVVNVASTSATLMWLVQTGEVAFGSAIGQLEHRTPVLRAERIHMTGLKPGTLQHYQAFPGEAGKGSFQTPRWEPRRLSL